MTNLSTELADFQKDIQTSVKTSEAEMKDLNEQLAKLQAVSVVDDLGLTTGTQTTKDELDFIFSEAEKAIEENETARSLAEEDCKCQESTTSTSANTISDSCKQLLSSSKTIKSENKNTKKSGNSEEKSNK